MEHQKLQKKPFEKHSGNKRICKSNIATLVTTTLLLISVIYAPLFYYYVNAGPKGASHVGEQEVGEASYFIWKDGDKYYSKEEQTNEVSIGTNASQAINNAMLAVSSSGGGVVFLKAAVYSLDTSVKQVPRVLVRPNVHLKGEGEGTVIKISSDQVFFGNFRPTGNWDFVSGFSEAENVILSDMTITSDDTSPNSGLAVNIRGVTNLRLYNLNIKCSGFGWIWRSHNILVNNCFIHGSIGSVNGITIKACTNFNIISNILNQTRDDGVAILGDDRQPYDYSEYGVITGNIISFLEVGSGIGLWSVRYVSVTGNTIYRNTGRGILLNNATYITLSGNIVKDNTVDGITIENNSHNNTITGNTIIDNSYTNENHNGIRLADATYNIISSNTIADTKFFPHQNWGILETGTANHNTIIGNTAFNHKTGGIRTIGFDTNVHLCWNGTNWIP